MLGILFNFAKLKRVIKGQEAHENINFYLRFAEEHQIDLFFFCPEWIKGKKAKGYKYSVEKKASYFSFLPVPKVNVVRTILSENQYQLIHKLERRQHAVFLNHTKGRDKYKVYSHLSRNKNIGESLPPTARLSYKTLMDFLNEYQHIVIKPSNGSLGKRIFTIEKNEEDNGYNIRSSYQGRKNSKKIAARDLFSAYRKLLRNPSYYLIQPYIVFQRYEGEKFDLRISVQKDKAGKWKVTGIVARVAGKNGIVTNVAQGGRVVSYKEIQLTLPARLKRRIFGLSVQIAKEIEALNPATTDLGLDLAIDEQNKIWFIEANYCDQRYAYRESKDLDMWEASFRTPLEYAFSMYKELALPVEQRNRKGEAIKVELVEGDGGSTLER